MADLCGKCGERPVSNGQRWCSRCRKGKGRTPGENAQGGERLQGENATLTADSAYTGFNVVVDRVPESNSVRRRKAIQKGECPHCAVLLAEVARLRLLVPEMERLRLDQARLKQELSEARVRSGEMVLMPGPATARGRVVRRTDAVGVPLAGGLGKVRGETLYARMLRSRGDE